MNRAAALQADTRKPEHWEQRTKTKKNAHMDVEINNAITSAPQIMRWSVVPCESRSKEFLCRQDLFDILRKSDCSSQSDTFGRYSR